MKYDYFEIGEVNNSMIVVSFVCFLRQDVDFVELSQTKVYPIKAHWSREIDLKKKIQEFLEEWEIADLPYFFLYNLGFEYSDCNPHITQRSPLLCHQNTLDREQSAFRGKVKADQDSTSWKFHYQERKW